MSDILLHDVGAGLSLGGHWHLHGTQALALPSPEPYWSCSHSEGLEYCNPHIPNTDNESLVLRLPRWELF